MNKPWLTREFWGVIIGALAAILEAFGIPHVKDLVAQFGPAFVTVVLALIAGKALKPGQTPFSAAK